MGRNEYDYTESEQTSNFSAPKIDSGWDNGWQGSHERTGSLEL